MAETKLWLVNLKAVGGGAPTELRVAAPDAWGALVRARNLDNGTAREQVSVAFLASVTVEDGAVPVTVQERLAALEAAVAALENG
jgi:hypothetical protein